MTKRFANPEIASRTYDGCVAYSEDHGCTLRQCGGHAVAKAPNGHIAPYPRHRGEYPRGTQRSILRMWKLMAIAAPLVVVWIVLATT